MSETLAGLDTMDDGPKKRADGKYEEKLDDVWIAEYAEDPDTGLWETEIFKHDVSEWHMKGYATLDECRQAAREFYDQS